MVFEYNKQTMKKETYANPTVLEFYRSLPFNYRDSVEEQVKAIRSTNAIATYPVLPPLLGSGVSVLEVGCGTGWLSNSMNFYYQARVLGIDFNPVAIARAQKVAREMKLKTNFQVEDLFLYQPKMPFEVVVSLGVLHHTNNCAAAVQRLCEHFVAPGGHIMVGLYHKYGRQPFLDSFQEMKERGATEAEMLARYRSLHSQLKDETHLFSWFRDQVLHPHETQHTVAEMLPILKESGMELVSTSLNRFQPIQSVDQLIAEESQYEDIARQRLKENKYFPGFFVFLARKVATRKYSPSLNQAKNQDTKPYIRHHPIIGYEYIPNTEYVLPRPGGGEYTMTINSAGIRSRREYPFKKDSHSYRILVFGDSMSAGQYVSNDHRFSELLERRLPGLEVINFSLEGTGTDQQLLLFEQVGKQYEYDLILLLPFLQNIRRNMVEFRIGMDPLTKEKVLTPKPRFELVNGELVLQNVPVPKERKPLRKTNEEELQRTDGYFSFKASLKKSLNQLAESSNLKPLLYSLVPREPFPEYKSSQTKEWQLMAAILRRFKHLATDKPLVIVPTFYSSYVKYNMARNYWQRFNSLADGTGIYAIDILPYFKALGAEAERCFQEPYDCHFSIHGNFTLANALETELRRLKFLGR